MRSVAAPALLQTPPATARPEIDAALNRLQAEKESWAGFDPGERRRIVEELLPAVTAVGERWVAAGCLAKGIEPGSFGEAEEWLFFAVITRALRLIRQVWGQIETGQRPSSAAVHQRQDGQLVVPTFPHSHWDRLLFRGIRGEVWLEPGVTPEDWYESPAEQAPGKVAVVLGAGNASMLPVIDTLHKLFVDREVVALKLNPVNAYLGPLIEEGFQALVSRGFLKLVYGGQLEGSYLCRHPAVDTLHLTGSAQTFEAITFGMGAAGARRKQERAPLNEKPFTGELGNVSPVIIVPGRWQRQEIQAQSEEIATWFVANAGYGCLTPRVIIQHQTWSQRHKLIESLGAVLDNVPPRPAYYPGARQRHALFIQAHPQARRYGDSGGVSLPWTLISGVPPEETHDVCFRQEAFCSVMAETALKAPDVAGFLEQAVDFANDVLWGSLNATLIVHPSSLREPGVAAAVERAIARLRYGAVLVNLGAFAAYYFQVTPWGAFPGHAIDDIQSGVGKTANWLMLTRPQKSVIRAPFNKWPDPLRLTAAQAPAFARRLAYFEAMPSLRQALPLIRSALWR